jgi:hypothetical protein
MSGYTAMYVETTSSRGVDYARGKRIAKASNFLKPAREFYGSAKPLKYSIASTTDYFGRQYLGHYWLNLGTSEVQG